MASSPAREQIHVRLSLEPQARAERIAANDRRSLASAASLVVEAWARARQGDISEGAVQHG